MSSESVVAQAHRHHRRRHLLLIIDGSCSVFVQLYLCNHQPYDVINSNWFTFCLCSIALFMSHQSFLGSTQHIRINFTVGNVVEITWVIFKINKWKVGPSKSRLRPHHHHHDGWSNKSKLYLSLLSLKLAVCWLACVFCCCGQKLCPLWSTV